MKTIYSFLCYFAYFLLFNESILTTITQALTPLSSHLVQLVV